MMQESLQRRLAQALLEFGIRIAPQRAAVWGQAMLAELSQVKGEWATLIWAAGGASVLAKHALLSLVFPGYSQQAVLPNGGSFDKGGPMRKAILSVSGACVVAAFLFLLAPAFRQGLGVALTQWHAMSHVRDWPPQTASAIKALEQHAEKKHDAEALAFVAMRVSDPAESTRLADEAVQLDPKLTWILAMPYGQYPVAEAWIQKLEQWDPQNALPYFIEAENIDIAQVGRNSGVEDEGTPAWQNALAAALQSLKLDDYHNRLRELDRRVAARYGLKDPVEVIAFECDPCLPSYTEWDASRYAKSVLKSGERSEARGDKEGALAKYSDVARFAEMIGPRLFPIQKEVYERLAELSQSEGKKAPAALYASLAQKAVQDHLEGATSWNGGMAATGVTQWNGDLMKVSGLLLPITAGLLLICGLTIIAKSRPLRLRSLHAGWGTAAFGLGSAVGLLLSSAMLYVSYRPYAEIFRQFVSTGNDGRLPDLRVFLSYAQVPLGVQGFVNGAKYVSYFWLVVIVLCVIALLVTAGRFLRVRPQAKVTT